MKLDVKLVEAFALIMRTGSLTKAETLGGQSKATLSRQLLKLEQTLGTQLLTRTSRSVVPTEAGRAFYAHCEGLLSEVSGRLEAAQTEIQELTTGASGALSLLSDNEFSTTFVCHVARLFLERHPNVHCRLDVAGRSRAPAVEEVDCYICGDPPELPNLVGKLLGRLGYGLYASPGYLARRGTPNSPLDLALHQSIVMTDAAAAEPVELLSEAATQPYVPRPNITTNDYWVMKTFCIDGFGIALLPDFFAQPEVKGNILQPVLPMWKPEKRRIYCAYQRQRFMGRKLRAFVDLMAECVADIESYNFYLGTARVPSGQARGRR